MKKSLLLITHFFANLLAVFSQDLIVKNDATPESEVHAAINPTDTANIIVGAISGFSYGNSPGNLSIYYTQDFGDSWQKNSFHGTPLNYMGAGDPVL